MTLVDFVFAWPFPKIWYYEKYGFRTIISIPACFYVLALVLKLKLKSFLFFLPFRCKRSPFPEYFIFSSSFTALVIKSNICSKFRNSSLHTVAPGGCRLSVSYRIQRRHSCRSGRKNQPAGRQWPPATGPGPHRGPVRHCQEPGGAPGMVLYWKMWVGRGEAVGWEISNMQNMPTE